MFRDARLIDRLSLGVAHCLEELRSRLVFPILIDILVAMRSNVHGQNNIQSKKNLKTRQAHRRSSDTYIDIHKKKKKKDKRRETSAKSRSFQSEPQELLAAIYRDLHF